ncbi:MAG: hypothetical protein V4657_09385 [Pseudomonadota bacterium]
MTTLDNVSGLTVEQSNALISIARFLDAAAGEAFGVCVDFEDGTSGHAFADDIVTATASAFGFELHDSPEPFGAAVREFFASRAISSQEKSNG